MNQRYPLTKEEKSLYLACVMAPERKYAYHFGWSVTLPPDTDKGRIRDAVKKVFARHRIFSARIEQDAQGNLWKYDSGLEPVIEEQRTDREDPAPEDFEGQIDLNGERLYRIVLVDTPSSVVLFIYIHHIVFDGTGRQVMVRDFEVAYRGEEIGGPDMAPYEFALREQEQEGCEEFEADRAYYQELLADIESTAPEPDASGETESFDRAIYTIERVDAADVKRKKDAAGVRTSTILLSAVGYAVALFSDSSYAVLASAMSGRTSETKNSSGMFVRTLPMICRTTPDRSVDEYLRDLDEQTTAGRKHSLYTYLDMNRDMGLVLPVPFAYQGDMLADRVLFDGAERKMNYYRANASDYELRLYIWRLNGKFLFEAVYRSDHYTRAFIDSLAQTVEQVLFEMMNRERLSDIHPVHPAQLACMEGWNHTEKEYPVTDVVTLFRRAADTYPDREAAVFRDEVLTYRELDEITDRIAGYLREQGIGRGDVVSVLITRSLNMVTASLGVLKTGAAYQPLDPSYPSDRLAFMTEDSASCLLIADEELRDRVPGFGGPVLFTKDIAGLPACERLTEHPSPEDLFSLVYTSGSTGKPKGAMLGHGNLANFCFWYANYFHADENCRVAAYASYGFDANMMDMYPALTVGGCVCIVEEEIRLDILAMGEWFDRNRITHSFMTTQVGRQFYMSARPKTLQHLFVGGEKLVPVPVREGTARFYNGYGPTECTIFTTICPVDREYGRIPIGRPLDNTRCYVVDANRRQLPLYAPGELLIAGRGVVQGYLNRPDLTEKVFIPNPFSEEPDYARTYRSGDVVRFLADGDIDFIGRNDGQVKIRGFRVELPEVESVVRSFPGITDATVQAFEDEKTGEKYIAAYIVSDGEVDITALHNHIRREKPPYMVPAVTMRLDRIPLNQNQKVDKRALPKPERTRQENIPPQNDTQKKIFDIIAEVVGHSDFGITTDLTEAGLSSIGALRLNVMLSQAFDMVFTTRDLLNLDTVEQLETMIREREGVGDAEELPVLDDYPLSKSQEGVYVDSLARPDTCLYNIPLLMEVDPSLETARVKAALAAAVNAHPFILTRLFVDEDGETRMRRTAEAVFDVSDVEERTAGSIEEIKGDLVRPYDMTGERLFRICLIHTNDGKQYLFLEIHHIIADGTSLNIFLADAARAYAGETLEPESYGGYESALEEERIRGTEAYTQAADWFRELLGSVDRTMLPDRDLADEGNPSSAEFSVPSGVDFTSVRRFCEQEKVTVNAFFNAVFSYCLARFCGKTDAVYTTIHNGRGDSRLARSMAMLVKTIPMVGHIEKEMPVRDFVSGIGRQLMNAMSHGSYSFAEMAHEFDLSTDVMFIYQGESFAYDSFCGKRATYIPLPLGEAKAPIRLQVFVQDGQPVYRCDYRSDCYSEAFMRCLVETVETVAGEFLCKKTLGEISLVNDAIVARMDAWNDTEADYPVTDIVSMFREAAEKYPDRPAVVYRDESLTYREMDEISDRIAGYLRAQGVGTGDVVSVLIPRCSYMPTASLGVLKAGAAYQPLDPNYPTERLEFMMEDADCRLLIADETLRERVSGYTGPVLFTGDIPGLPACEKSPEHPAPEDLFILIYTSGSTGKPKGVMLEHRNIANFCYGYREYVHLTLESRVSAYASYGFDVCMMDMYPTLTAGACLYVMEEEIRLDFPAMEKWINRNRITHAFMTTQVGRQFYLSADVDSLQYLVVAGEALVSLTPREGGPTMINGYGPSETSIITTFMSVDKKFYRIPIGQPGKNVRCYVVDENMHRLPPLVPGELLIAGRGVARGYLNRPDITEKAFVENPFSRDASDARAYHSGDIVRLLPNGDYDFIGRNDGQVKVRGFRIELSEVENVIREYPGMRDATVIARDMGEAGKALAAYIVSDETVDIEALGDFIRERKPAYMVPSWTIQLDAIPLNQNGKVNKRALPEPTAPAADAAGSDGGRAVDNLLEKALKAEISRITENEVIPYEVPLSEAGLTSIGVIRLSAFVYKRFGVNLGATRFRGITLLKLENEILSAWMDGRTADAESGTAEVRDVYPLSAVQQAIYFDTMKNTADAAYNIPLCLRFTDIDAERLASAVTAAVRAHAYLNTVIQIRDGAFVQVRPEDVAPEVAVRTMEEEEWELYRKGFIRPFNLSAGPLYRIEIVRTPSCTYLVMDFHHIVFDGFSVDILSRDIDRAYNGESLQPETRTYFDYALEDSRFPESREYEEAEKYYADLLSAFDAPSDLDPDRSGDPEHGTRREKASRVGRATVDTYCRENGVTHASVFYAAFAYVLSRFTASEGVLISTISAGRGDARNENVIGMFVHTIPLALTFETDRTAGELFTEATRVMEDAVAHEAYPMAELAARYGFSTNIMYECQIGVMSGEKKLGGCTGESVSLGTPPSKFRLSLLINEGTDEYRIRVLYNDALYSDDYMHTLADAVALAVSRMLSEPGMRMKELSLLTDEERTRVAGFSCTKQREIPTGLLHRMFEETADAQPERTALIACDRTLTYRELEAEANRVARALLRHGVGAGDRVLLLLKRKSTYFSALFGVLKTGAAFVPCDPEYPMERIRYIAENAGARLMVTENSGVDNFPELAVDVDELIAETDDTRPEAAVTPESEAYIIYTSGSTGNPKGVILTHRGICNYCMPDSANILYDPETNTYETMVSVTTVSFDMSLKDTVGMLVSGRTVVFADEQQMNDPRALAQLIRESGADAFNATPSRYLQYMEYEPFREALAGCHLLMAGGEPYPPKLLTELQSLGRARLINTYGPTEVTISSNMADLTDAETVTVGKPLCNVHEYIVDRDGNPLPAGVVGELFIGGPGVARGYVKLPEKTAAGFIDYNGERVYRSGDYAKWDRDGNVVILGRMDGQVKLRGLRIELSEITGMMESLPGIKRAVCAIKQLNGQDNLCAYFTAEDRMDIGELHDALAARLTHYMVPTAFMQLEKIPVTHNGKTDLRALPLPEILETGEYVAPANEVETYFCDLFARVLHLEKAGACDDFFAIGGTSLSATSIMIDATENGYTLTYGDVFKYKTPRGLAALFTEDGEGVKTGAESPFADYAYDGIREVLQKNTLDSFAAGELRPIGNILLTGATGFMGIHVLAEFLRTEKGTVTCLIRKGRFDNPLLRLKNMLFYYFGDAFEGSLERVRVVDGDVRKYEAFETLEGEKIQTVFNCAASVKHFSSGTDIEDINVGGAVNCVRFCERTGARLIHFSTTSVAGGSDAFHPLQGEALDERSLYIGQIMDNQYVSSKFLAERTVLEAVASRGLDAKIIRVGTLSPRESDGEFQINILSNSFMERLRSYVLLKEFPISQISAPMRLGPIDTSATAILLLARTPRECCLFHAVNSHMIPTVDVIRQLIRTGFDIGIVEDDEFYARLSEAERDPEKAAIFSGLLAYKRVKPIKPIPVACEYTVQVLARMGFFWNIPNEAYVRQFIETIMGLGFFDDEFLIR